MLKMMKYEIKRNRLSYFFMLAVLLLLELVFSVGMLLEKEVVFSLSIIGLMFFGFAGILFVAINGTNIYSKDLKKKTGYMVFMTPISSYKVLGAKLLAVFCSSLVLLIIYVGIGLIDVFWVIEAYSIKEFEPLV
ncbi:MAG TPA: ABC transporter permease, partial [Lachnospiraceae bacterium]